MKLKIPIKFETGHKEETPSGIFYGKEVVKYVELTPEEVKKIIQQHINEMDYREAEEFYKKYNK